MSWLLFMDESGHDHKQMPYEVRGGIALQDKSVAVHYVLSRVLKKTVSAFDWQTSRRNSKAQNCSTKTESSGPNRNRRKEAKSGNEMRGRSFPKGCRRNRNRRDEFTWLRSSLPRIGTRYFSLLRDHDAKLFASVIPRWSQTTRNV